MSSYPLGRCRACGYFHPETVAIRVTENLPCVPLDTVVTSTVHLNSYGCEGEIVSVLSRGSRYNHKRLRILTDSG